MVVVRPLQFNPVLKLTTVPTLPADLSPAWVDLRCEWIHLRSRRTFGTFGNTVTFSCAIVMKLVDSNKKRNVWKHCATLIHASLDARFAGAVRVNIGIFAALEFLTDRSGHFAATVRCRFGPWVATLACGCRQEGKVATRLVKFRPSNGAVSCYGSRMW